MDQSPDLVGVTARRRPVPALALGGLVLVVAFVPRLLTVLGSAGLGGTFGYDASVYYAAADGLVHGRMPYRDYLLLHPPGITVVLSPFAALGTLLGDHRGFMLATLAWMLLGSINAVLVYAVALTMGLGRRGALAGGLFYGVWWSAVNAEFLIRLEPLGNTFLLLGLLALARSEAIRQRGGPVARRLALLCGAGFGAATAVKIWWAMPLVLVLAWHLVPRRRAALPWTALGAAAALLAIDGPFFLAAPRQMWSMVVLDQLGRGSTEAPLRRALDLTGLRGLFPGLEAHRVLAWTVCTMIGVVVVGLCVAARGARTSGFVLALFATQLVVLAAGPSWFSFYADFAAPAAALVLAAALRSRGARPAPGARTVSVALGIAAGTALLLVLDLTRPGNAVAPFPRAALAPAVANVRCLVSDSPMPMIELDTLSVGFDRGCPDWVDVTGRTYGVDADVSNGGQVWRRDDPKWQRDLRLYLFAGDAVVLFRPTSTGIGPRLHRDLAAQRVLGRAGGLTVYRIRSAGQERVRTRDLDLP